MGRSSLSSGILLKIGPGEAITGPITSTTGFDFSNISNEQIRGVQMVWTGTGLTGSIQFKESHQGTGWSNMHTSTLDDGNNDLFAVESFAPFTQVNIKPTAGQLDTLVVYVTTTGYN
jgi:hypothetical protein